MDHPDTPRPDDAHPLQEVLLQLNLDLAESLKGTSVHLSMTYDVLLTHAALARTGLRALQGDDPDACEALVAVRNGKECADEIRDGNVAVRVCAGVLLTGDGILKAQFPQYRTSVVSSVAVEEDEDEEDEEGDGQGADNEDSDAEVGYD